MKTSWGVWKFAMFETDFLPNQIVFAKSVWKAPSNNGKSGCHWIFSNFWPGISVQMGRPQNPCVPGNSLISLTPTGILGIRGGPFALHLNGLDSIGWLFRDNIELKYGFIETLFAVDPKVQVDIQTLQRGSSTVSLRIIGNQENTYSWPLTAYRVLISELYHLNTKSCQVVV